MNLREPGWTAFLLVIGVQIRAGQSLQVLKQFPLASLRFGRDLYESI